MPRYQKSAVSLPIHVAYSADAQWALSVKTAKWVGDCFIYTTSSNRLNYFVGTESYTITPFDQYVLVSRLLDLH